MALIVNVFLLVAPAAMAILGCSFWLCARRSEPLFTLLNIGLSSLAALVLPLLLLGYMER